MTYSIKDPEHRDAEVSLASLPTSFDAREERMEILLSPMHDADRDINLCMHHALCFEALDHAICDELEVFRSEQALGDSFEGHHETMEVSVLVEPVRLLSR